MASSICPLLVCVSLLFSFCYKACGSSILDTTSAFFIFGDSVVDTGNNNYINTIPEFKANYKPYGQNGFFQEPTGRFSHGRVIVDFIAEYAKLPIIPPFLQPSIQYNQGVNFASGGAGALLETHKGLVIDFQTQMRNFEEVQKSLIDKIGKKHAENLISEAVYFISIGSNDYIGGYMGGFLGNQEMQQTYNPQQYVQMVIGNLTETIQFLYKKGGRKFGFLSLTPLGCLPALRALNTEGSCLEEANALAKAHNNALNVVLKNLEYTLKGFKYCNSNLYEWLLERINNPSNYGYKEGVNACCGTGPYGGIYTCGGTKKISEYQLCDNVEDYVWWDSVHATEKIHEQFAKVLWNERDPSFSPNNLQQLFFENEKLIIEDVVDKPMVDNYQFHYEL